MQYRQNDGFSLIEVLVALFVLSVGLLGLANLQSTSIKNSLDLASQSQATWLAADLAERMHANPDGLSSYVTGAGNNATPDCSALPYSCSDTHTSPATACSSQQLAAFDLWEIFCGDANISKGLTASSNDSLHLMDLTVHCKTDNCEQNPEYLIALAWQPRITSSTREHRETHLRVRSK